jgi:Tfp pilus assembly protein PilF
MRITEDAMQDARLALLERGGPVSVPNVDAWLTKTARRLQAQQWVKKLYEDEALALFSGDYERAGRCREILWERDREKHRLQRRLRGDRQQYVREVDRIAARRKTWRESQARRRARQKEKVNG